MVERFFVDGRVPRGAGWARVAKVAARKLDVLDYADVLGDLRSPPGNQLEALKGGLAGMHSIRINNQWRVVFCWTDAGPRQSGCAGSGGNPTAGSKSASRKAANT